MSRCITLSLFVWQSPYNQRKNRVTKTLQKGYNSILRCYFPNRSLSLLITQQADISKFGLDFQPSYYIYPNMSHQKVKKENTYQLFSVKSHLLCINMHTLKFDIFT